MVAMGIFAAVSVSFMMVMLSATRGSDTALSVSAVSGEARLGFNRLVRDVREAEDIDAAGPTSFRIFVDFDGWGRPTPNQFAQNAAGDFEVLTYSFDPTTAEIRLNGEVLMEGVDCPRTSGGSCSQTLLGSAPWSSGAYGSNPPNVFAYLSNRLEYDWNKDGVTTWQELDLAGTHGIVGVGNNNGILDGAELELISSIAFNFVVSDGDSSSRFRAEAQLRNQR